MDERALFLDDYHIGKLQGLERRAHCAERHGGNPLITREYQWEQARCQVYGRCVVYNSERDLYQMYYLAMPRGEHYPNVRVGGVTKPASSTFLVLAESEDGIEWKKSMRSDVPFEDEALTNILDIHDGVSAEQGILYDEHDPDGSRRYKAFIFDQHNALPVPGKQLFLQDGTRRYRQIVNDDGAVLFEQDYVDFGIRVAFSQDGVHWNKHNGWALKCYSDTGQSPIYDPKLGKYVSFGRFNHSEFRRGDQVYSPRHLNQYYVWRNVSRVESDDFLNWSDPELVVSADSDDPPSLQINSMPTDLYEGVYVGLLEVDCRPLETDSRPMQLATSRDSRVWTRVADRAGFIEPVMDESAWDYHTDGKSVRPSTGLFTAGDRVRFYYSGYHEEHGMAIGMASWRRDGFVSLHGGPEGGQLLTRPFIVRGPKLHLNLDASDGECTVQVCDLQGAPRTGQEVDSPYLLGSGDWAVSRWSQPVRGDHLDAIVDWPDSDLHDRIGKPVTLRIELRNADLYSFWLD